MATQPAVGTESSSTTPLLHSLKQRVALPLHVQKLQRALNLDRFIDQVERVFNEALSLDSAVRYVTYRATANSSKTSYNLTIGTNSIL